MPAVTHLVVGAGQAGTAVHQVLSRAHDAAIRDVDPVEVHAEVLHICFPWSDLFVWQVRGYQRQHTADLVVVHSTVPVGTCDPEGWVHSPVRGRHPDLADSLLTFTKHFGGGRADQAAKVFEVAGCDVRIHPRAAETEAGKLWELVQFGLQVRIEQQIHDWCTGHGIDPDVVYRDFAVTYNDGYRRLSLAQFVRPVLEHVPGPIGGHCVRQCAVLLDHPLAAEVAR
jgi:hypothetical protein